MKKIIIGILGVVICTSILPVSANAKQNTRDSAFFHSSVRKGTSSASGSGVLNSIGPEIAANVTSDIKVNGHTVNSDFSRSYGGKYGSYVANYNVPPTASVRNGIYYRNSSTSGYWKYLYRTDAIEY